MATTKRSTRFPTRGAPGGWRDVWDDPDVAAELRAKAEATERRLAAAIEREGHLWRREEELVRRTFLAQPNRLEV